MAHQPVDSEVSFMTAPAQQQKTLAELNKQYPFDELDERDERIHDKTLVTEVKRILRYRRERHEKKIRENNLEHILQNFTKSLTAVSSKSENIPEFRGSKDESANAHLLKVQDWKDRMEFSDREIVEKFKQTLGDKAREWYNEIEELPNSWEDLKKQFTLEFTKAGKPKRALKAEWTSYKYDPDKQDIRDFIREVKQTAQLLNLDDEAILETLKDSLPEQGYFSVNSIKDLPTLITTLKDLYNSRRRGRESNEEVKTSSQVFNFNVTDKNKDKQNQPQKYTPRITQSFRGRPNTRPHNSYPMSQRQQEFQRPQNRQGFYRNNFQNRYNQDSRNQRFIGPRPRPRSLTPRREDRRCFLCNEQGHLARNCRNQFRGQNRQFRNRSNSRDRFQSRDRSQSRDRYQSRDRSRSPSPSRFQQRSNSSQRNNYPRGTSQRGNYQGMNSQRGNYQGGMSRQSRQYNNQNSQQQRSGYQYRGFQENEVEDFTNQQFDDNEMYDNEMYDNEMYTNQNETCTKQQENY